jgi:hypothetical protein
MKISTDRTSGTVTQRQKEVVTNKVQHGRSFKNRTLLPHRKILLFFLLMCKQIKENYSFRIQNIIILALG